MFRVNVTISAAMSASRIVASAPAMFSLAMLRELIVVSSVSFWIEPRVARVSETVWIAASIASIAAPAPVERFSAFTASVLESWFVIDTETESLELAPIWNTWLV